jgi:hypothetical protein
MAQPWWRVAPTSGLSEPSANLRRRLDEIGQSVDWRQFDKCLRWLDPRGECTGGYEPIKLFRALLIQQWYALVAPEYEYCLSDSMSCRRFVGLVGDEPPPSNEIVASFRRLIVERGIASELYAELNRQLETLGLKDLPDYAADRDRLAEAPLSPRPLRIVEPLGPPEWIEIEKSFLNYWNKARKDRSIPRLSDIKLGAIPELRPYAILLRVLPDLDDFRYEFAGEKVVEGNGGDPTGATIIEKINHNIRHYGHRGLQTELQATYCGAVKRLRPVSTSTYFVNAGVQKAELWVTVAPLAAADDRAVEMVFGVALIKPILFN